MEARPKMLDHQILGRLNQLANDAGMSGRGELIDWILQRYERSDDGGETVRPDERIEFVRRAAIALRAARSGGTANPQSAVDDAIELWELLQKAGC